MNGDFSRQVVANRKAAIIKSANRFNQRERIYHDTLHFGLNRCWQVRAHMIKNIRSQKRLMLSHPCRK